MLMVTDACKPSQFLTPLTSCKTASSANKEPIMCNLSPCVHHIHDKATNCLWIAGCGWNPSFRLKVLSSSLKAINHKNVTNMVWHCFLELINECSYIHGGKSHTDRFEGFCLALEQWRKSLFMCVLALNAGWLGDMQSSSSPYMNL